MSSTVWQYILAWLVTNGHIFKAFFTFYKHHPGAQNIATTFIGLDLKEALKFNIRQKDFCGRALFPKDSFDVSAVLKEEKRIAGLLNQLKHIFDLEERIYSSMRSADEVNSPSFLRQIIKLSKKKQQSRELIQLYEQEMPEGRIRLISKLYLPRIADIF